VELFDPPPHGVSAHDGKSILKRIDSVGGEEQPSKAAALAATDLFSKDRIHFKDLSALAVDPRIDSDTACPQAHPSAASFLARALR
jgi:hypothetical protein